MHRITDPRHSEYLSDLVGQRDLHDGFAVLRTQYLEHSEITQRLLVGHPRGGLTKGYTVENGSMSLTYATLWTTAVMLVAPPYPETPWDAAPNLGICERLGFRPFAVIDGTIRAYSYVLKPEHYPRRCDIIWLHERQIWQLAAWCGRADIPFLLRA